MTRAELYFARLSESVDSNKRTGRKTRRHNGECCPGKGVISRAERNDAKSVSKKQRNTIQKSLFGLVMSE